MIKKNLLCGFLIVSWVFALGQNQKPVADKIIAIVGNEIILKSDIEKKLANFPKDSIDEEQKACKLLANSIQKKLLLTKAKADSVPLKSQRVENELDRRIAFFKQKVGSKRKLEKYYNKNISEIKEEMRQPIRELLLTEKTKKQIVSDVKVSPKEVKQYFRNLPPDSIPYFNTKVQLGHIVRKPKPTQKAKNKARKKIKRLRERIVEEGESFDNLAILYSDDESSATNGGDLGMRNKNSLNDKLAAKALNLQKGKVSEVIKTEKGYHIVKLLDRKGDRIHLKHILIEPDITPKARENTRQFLDSIANLIRKDSISFEKAAYKFSEDEQTKNNGGMIVNKQTGSNKIPLKQINSEMFFNIDTLDVGSISKTIPMNYNGIQNAYRILYLKSRTPPHRANLKQDYPRIRRMAEQKAKKEAFRKWLKQYADKTYIKLKTTNTNCEGIKPYLQKQ